MARAFSVQDNNTFATKLVSTRTRDYKDIDLSFSRIPGTTATDILKKTDAASVRQAVKTLLLTNRNEKPFNPNFGGNLADLLFSLNTEMDGDLIEEYIQTSMELFEPRAEFIKVILHERVDSHSADITVYFRVVNTQELVSLQINLTRLR